MTTRPVRTAAGGPPRLVPVCSAPVRPGAVRPGAAHSAPAWLGPSRGSADRPGRDPAGRDPAGRGPARRDRVCPSRAYRGHVCLGRAAPGRVGPGRRAPGHVARHHAGPGRDGAAGDPSRPGRTRGPRRTRVPGTGQGCTAQDRAGGGHYRGPRGPQRRAGTTRDPARRTRGRHPGARRGDPVDTARSRGRVGSAEDQARARRHTTGPDPCRAIVARSSDLKC